MSTNSKNKRAREILQEQWDKVIIPSEMQKYATELGKASINAMIKYNELDNLPIHVYEVYETIERLLSPEEKIVEMNPQISDCILLMLNNLYNSNQENEKRD